MGTASWRFGDSTEPPSWHRGDTDTTMGQFGDTEEPQPRDSGDVATKMLVTLRNLSPRHSGDTDARMCDILVTNPARRSFHHIMGAEVKLVATRSRATFPPPPHPPPPRQCRAGVGGDTR